MRALSLSFALSLAVGAATVVNAAPVAAAVPDPGFGHYVALGDSFTAGPLIPGMSSLECVRSNNNYPSTLGVKLGVYYEADKFSDVSCSGADTTSMAGRFTTAIGTSVGPQFDALRPDTDLVTLGIGGNDEAFFGTLITECPALRATDPGGNPCQDAYTKEGVDTMAAIVPRTRDRVGKVIQGIKERSPHARIVVVGYLRMMPANGIPCADVPMAAGDVPWVDGLERKLNAALATAASENGVTFVDTYGPSLGHDACAGEDAWVQGGYLDLLESIAWHPLRSGMDAVAQLTYDKLNGTDLAAHRLVSASSTESGHAPSHATDQDPYTRWASGNWQNGEWLSVDLGSRQTVRRLELNWEYAYAKGYRVEASDDGRTWRTVWSTINGDGGHDTVRFSATSTRYIRILGVTRATNYGISLHDVEVYRT